ncbi:hypothetical protein JRI60_39710 [Archangium violaceum]|uniref:hypothetical protein n=1 Tax=Archangium violaceum TaxID=83451 RepID=UPI00194FBA59|nr:hypothetical protein [Archangium violaceum]QRN95160.1 hypothetical protein JRI60_39710 [Archangium violaceum]
MRTEHDDEKDPALTEEIRAILHPRARLTMWLTVTLALGLGAAAWLASRTLLAALWR